MLNIRLGYDHKDFTEAQIDALIANYPFAKDAIGEKDGKRTVESWQIGKQRVTIEEAAALEAAGIKIQIEGVDGTMITRMTDRGDERGEKTPLDLLEAKVVQIAVPDIGLLLIDDVTWLDDACTEELQAHLNDGWRILAVCPPNAQRRPDYILGRRKKAA